jgi:hypothetical protein
MTEGTMNRNGGMCAKRLGDYMKDWQASAAALNLPIYEY